MNRICKVGIASMVLGLVATAASAETFTFTSNSTVANSIVVQTMGPTPIANTFINSTSVVTYANGTKVSNTASCSSWTVMPGATPFNANGICTYTEKNGDQDTIIYGCITDDKTGSSDCWGGLRGVSGTRAGKTGTISWHGTVAADRKTGAAMGTGQWN